MNVRLSPQNKAVLDQFAAKPDSYERVAARMCISKSAVQFQVSAICKAFGVKRLTEALVLLNDQATEIEIYDGRKAPKRKATP
jgi:DNA-binding CsgD family transcriptional regulator